jgi:hypothetical protein
MQVLTEEPKRKTIRKSEKIYKKNVEKEVQSASGGCRGSGDVPQLPDSPKIGG